MIPLGVAAGHLKRPGQVSPLLAIDSDILKYITLGSFTLRGRPGNDGTTFWEDFEQAPTALNSLGMPNPGMPLDSQAFLDLGDTLHKQQRVGRISVAGFDADEYAMLAERLRFLSGRFYHLELNLGCPNVTDGGKHHSVISFNPRLIDDILQKVWKAYDTVGLAIAVKLSPYSDPYLLQEVAAVIASQGPNGCHVDQIVTCNTFPKAIAYDHDGVPCISGGYAGLSGKPLKQIALGQVRQFRELLPHNIHIVGVGGISTAKDVRDMELAGAYTVQIGTAFFRNGDPCVFQQIAEEYAANYD